MANLPEASLTINESSGAFAGGTGYIVVMGCVSQNADFMPRIFSSTQGMLDVHDYAPAIDYCSHHFEETRKPVIFVPLPIATQGVIGSYDNSGVTGTSAVTVTAGGSGPLEKVDAQVTIVTGTTVGTDQISFDLSLDGGWSTQRVRLGTSTSYVIPKAGLTLHFGPGTLNAADVFTFRTTAPMWGSTAITSARASLAAQENLARSWLVEGVLPTSTFAGYITTETNGYETANERFTYARAQVPDFLPLAAKSKVTVKATGTPSLTFAASGHTITRVAGSWVTEGFVVGQIVAVTGSTSNNGTIGVLTAVSSTVLTFASGVVNEGPTSAAVVSASDTLTFAASGHTITRSAGSWISDGFAVGQTVVITGTSSNNTTLVITALSATVMTFGSGLADEGPIATSAVTIVRSSTFGLDVAAQTAAFATVDSQKRIDLGYGFARKQSPITGWSFRRPAAWAASVREYQHDVQIPCWRKADGPLDGWSLTDTNGNKVEFDERVDGGALAGRFTCFRSYGNGPRGAFIALSLTRDTEGALLSRTHNMSVTNLACTIVQAETENDIGQVLVLNPDGTGTDASLSILESRVNHELQINLLQNFKEGSRASNAVWTANRGDDLSQVGATLNGSLALELDGTIENIATTVRVS